MSLRQPGLFPQRILFLALILTCLPGRASPGSKPAASPRWIAGAICEKGEKPDPTVTAEVAGISLEARPLAVSDWEARIERHAPGMGTALRRHDGSEGPFQVFLLALRNHSPEALRFQPGNIVRILDVEEQDHIMDFTDLYRYLHEEDKNPDSLDRIHDTFFDSGLVLARGDSVERLLFFRPLAPKGKKKQLTLLLSSFQVGTETHQAALSWHAEKEKK
jgi:hypothetical protein